MKFLKYCFILCLTLCINSLAQNPNVTEEIKEEMAKLAVMEGKWEGESKRKSPDGSEVTSFVTENLYYKLDNSLMLLEGRGVNENKEVVHDAFAVVTYNPETENYEMKSYLADGRSTEANFEVIEPNKEFRWWFEDQRGGTIRYNLIFNGGQWLEIGEYSRDGENWMQFFEMNLQKIE